MGERRSIMPSPAVSGMTAYSVPRHGAPIDLWLDGNEGAAPPAELIERIAAAGTEAMRRYPDARPLEERIASMIGIDPGRLIVTAGGDDAIYRALKSVLAPGRELILPEPTFEMFERYARLAGGEVARLSWAEGPYPVEDVIAGISERTAAIAVVSPNNPTGLVVSEDDLRRLSAAAPHALIVVDLAYAEFADRDLTGAALELPNAVVIRTLSKAWGLAGLRVGWAAGPAEVIGWMRAAGNPYAVSSASLAIAEERLSHRRSVGEFVSTVRSEVKRISRAIEDLGGRVLPSQANFVLAKFPDAAWVRDGLAGLGIAVRAFPGRERLEDSLRITMPGNGRDFDRLLSAIETVLAPEAIIFDIDDTLADVTESYRRSIVETARSFGAAASPADVARLKAAGNSTNDWELTWRLLGESGIEASFEEVRRRFEAIYQGTGERRGLKENESLMVDSRMLERLSRRLRLGIVTGRPRSDAAAFLAREGIDRLFSAVVAMEDGPQKPDPVPVKAALSALGASRAWMAGDTPDDMRAARAAGVLPIGVVAPSDDPEAARAALTGAGAARVFLKLSQIEEVVP
ncbi:MAG: aminotransferase class I/II-fold pyridoxal phosphate-dependent enzyme [Proteobacteria bacterium]|nr:aminotransferase class I/II-fold pyridoxal phosphate-dependent enzyme [Pseudomonadota bacterium]